MDEASSAFAFPFQLAVAVVVNGVCPGSLCAAGPAVEELLLSRTKVGVALLTEACVLTVLATFRGTKAKGEAIAGLSTRMSSRT